MYQISNGYKHDYGFLLSFVTEQFRSCFWLLAAFRIIINCGTFEGRVSLKSKIIRQSLASNKQFNSYIFTLHLWKDSLYPGQ